MSTGLLALLDDIVAIAKVAAASLDDAAGQAVKVGAKATGIVIDDAAVTPRYVVGFTADRELPIIGKIAIGSLKNKIIILLPGALALSILAPWSLPPLLMLGGIYLCLEGFHKVAEMFHPHAEKTHAADQAAPATTQISFEDAKVASAIRTDFILSAEIMAISIAAVAASSFWMKAVLLGIVGTGMTALVYGAVAIIVKADDVGVAMAQTGSRTVRILGRAIVKAMPGLLQALSFIGMVAMLWVGGGIVVHSLAQIGWHAPENAVHAAAERVSKLAPGIGGALDWFVGAAISAVIGLAIGALSAPVADRAIAPLAGRVGKAIRRFRKKSA